ncbi:hypothetical protein D3C76_1384690 [compost metagenome]
MTIDFSDHEAKCFKSLPQVANRGYVIDIPVILPSIAIHNIDKISDRLGLNDLSSLPAQPLLQFPISADHDA